MAAIVVVSKRTSGSEADHLFAELVRWAESATVGAHRRDGDTLELAFNATDVDHATAVRSVEEVLNVANPSWPVHVGIAQP